MASNSEKVDYSKQGETMGLELRRRRNQPASIFKQYPFLSTYLIGLIVFLALATFFTLLCIFVPPVGAFFAGAAAIKFLAAPMLLLFKISTGGIGAAVATAAATTATAGLTFLSGLAISAWSIGVGVVKGISSLFSTETKIKNPEPAAKSNPGGSTQTINPALYKIPEKVVAALLDAEEDDEEEINSEPTEEEIEKIKKEFTPADTEKEKTKSEPTKEAVAGSCNTASAPRTSRGATKICY